MNIDYSLLKKTFHISYLRPYQQLIIGNILDCHERRQEGRLLAVLPTGGGKSLCFMYPIRQLSIRAVLIYPLLSLMSDQKERFDSISLAKLEENFILYGYDEVCSVLPSLVHGRARYNDEKVSMAFCSMLGEDASVGRDWSTDLKARKNPVELEGMRKSHVMDAVAFINAFSRIDFSATDSTYSEISISDAFEEARKRLPGYLGPSFSPISGFGPNGAMCHYSATAESNAAIDRPGLLVLDTGSQFDCGMTDITRTLLFGEATAEQKKDYTLTLKGHLALSRAVFIQGTRGYQLDVLAKQFMWAEGMSFYHGTGHGVGFNLNVHEGPMRISAAPVDVPLETGMVISDEPGIYKEGRHGIRIENLIAVKEDMKTEFGQFLSFEVLTLVPYERRLIDLALLSNGMLKGEALSNFIKRSVQLIH